MPEVVNTSFLGSNIDTVENLSEETMIKIDDVSMVFNMASETMNNLKEYVIALARGELRFKEFRALDHISFEVKKGDVFGILGTNGSGKSTLLKIIAGVLEPSEGTCTVNGSIAPLIELGAGFDMELTARENIFLNGALLGYSKKFIEEHFDEIVEFAEIEQFLDMPLKNYSSGMVARIAFAIATVIVPEILIIDEVLSVGDFMFQQKCERRIQSLINDYGVTVLIVSHDNNLIERLCNKAVWIEKGHLRTIGTTKDICHIYQILGGRIGSSQAEKEIFQIFQNPIKPNSHRAKVLTGHDRFSTNARIADATLFKSKPTLGFIVPANNPNLCLLAESLAPIVNAVVILTLENDFPESAIPSLEKFNLKNLYIFGSSSFISDYVVKQISEHIPCNTKRIEGTNEFEITASLREVTAANKSVQEIETLVLADQSASLYLIPLSPYFCKSNCLLSYFSNSYDINDLLKKHNQQTYKRIIIVTSKDKHNNQLQPFVDATNNKTIFFDIDKEPWETNLIINQWITDNTDITYSNLVFVNEAVPDDGYTIGHYAGSNNSLILLENPNNLDNVINSYRFIMNNPVNSLTFIGGSLFNKTDKDILLKAIEMREMEN